MIDRKPIRRGFTLLEVVIAISLLVLLMTMLMMFYNNALVQRDEGTKRSRDAQLARVILDRMAGEVRQAVGNVPGYGVGVFGYKDRIEVNTLVMPDRKLSEVQSVRQRKLPAQFDLQQIRYYVAWDEENLTDEGDPRALGLVRRESKTYLRDAIVTSEEAEESAEEVEEAEMAFKEELYAPEIRFLELKYFDGATWWDDWELTQGNSLPQLVRITIGFEPVIPEEQDMDIVEDDFLEDDADVDPLPGDRYSILVRPVQADVFFGSRMSREASAFSEGL
ncbi:MAG TPA: prepilin-type N-terminal cleavage/methylation domain-containing protein [Phycisphaerae bacterium]|nr:prepilin-type N-terminal cleavage/methylation domain-containing protein [Phycisphaerales bacterium]HNO79339.1 prepilin-type N-terminal cleavage/methylation domain-containing protein [Phycisphaerae bacterium]